MRHLLLYFVIGVLVPGGLFGFQESNGNPATRQLSAVVAIQPITIDGNLDEEAWALAQEATDFLQSEPYEGQPATEATQVRVLYDQHNLYFGVYCYDSESGKLVVRELTRDFGTGQTDAFGISIDSFHDGRNTVTFFTNPGGAMRDEQSFDDGRFLNLNWDGIWFVAVRLQPDGWSAEFRIPFKTLRLKKSGAQTLGLNFYRNIRRKNEQVYWSPVPRRFNIYRASLAGLLEISDVTPGQSFRIKPYVVGRMDSRRESREDSNVSLTSDIGVDLKYGLTVGTTLDLTLNPDFSQAEVDTQQINLTRFSLFFPEKREFFQENAGFFHFGDIPGERRSNRQEEMRLFYSRRIGLSADGEPVPLMWGARMSGTVGAYALGLLDMQQREFGATPATNFSVARIRRNILANSDIGAMFVNKQSEGDFNRSYGVDANFQLVQNLTINTYIAQTRDPGPKEASTMWKAAMQWKSNFTAAQFVFTDVDSGFNPEVGFVPRKGDRLYRGSLNLNPRPRENRFIREFAPFAVLRYHTDLQNSVVSRDDHYEFRTNFHDGSTFALFFNNFFERIDESFPIREDVEIPVGSYHFDEYGVILSSNRSAPLSANLNVRTGAFYHGKKTTVRGGASAIKGPRYSASLSYRYDKIRLPEAHFINRLLGVRLDFSISPRLFFNVFVQYNSNTDKVVSNLRFRWIHRPLSDIYIVYAANSAREAGGESSKALLLKYTHALEF